jgi:hypothetical protein
MGVALHPVFWAVEDVFFPGLTELLDMWEINTEHIILYIR